MAIESIPTFGGNDSENTSGSDDNNSVVGETVQTLELTEGQIETYHDYESYVDMGRAAASLREHDHGDDLAALFEWIVEQKDELRKECKELPGNLPMFRKAFPVEDRPGYGEDFYVLPSEVAAKLGINYDDEDTLTLPISDGKAWLPSVSLGRPTYIDDEWSEDHNEAMFGGDDGESSEAESGDDSEAEASFDISHLTVADIRATITNVEDVETLEAMLTGEKSGEARKTAIEAIEARIRAVEDSSDDDDSEAVTDRFEGKETTEGVSEAVANLGDGSDESDEAAEASNDDDESDEVAAAKVEALNAATAAISELTDAIKNL